MKLSEDGMAFDTYLTGKTILLFVPGAPRTGDPFDIALSIIIF